MTIIEQIKAEIERRREANKRQYLSSSGDMSWERMCGEEDCLVELLAFLSTLESEKPMREELEEEIKRYGKEEMPVVLESDLNDIARHFAQWGKEQGYREGFLEGAKIQREEDNQLYETFTTTNDLEEAAEKHASMHPLCNGKPAKNSFIAGAKWQAEQLLKSSPLPEDTVLFNKGVEEGKRLMMEEWLKDRDGCFWDGVNEGKKAMKEKMLEEARNHFVYNILSGNDMKKMIEIYNDEVSCKPGDVVRIIIVKED